MSEHVSAAKRPFVKFNTSSSVRRILKRGGQELQKIWEVERSESEIVPLKISPIFRPKLGEEQKKKGLHSNFVRFSPKRGCKPKRNAQNIALCVIKPYAQLAKGGGGLAAILHTILCNYTILAIQKGGHGPKAPPLNTPLNTRYITAKSNLRTPAGL